MALSGASRRKQIPCSQHLAELREHGPGPAQRVSDAVHEMVERLSANYHELEKSVADRVRVSREVLQEWQEWQDETRRIMREIRRMTSALPA